MALRKVWVDINDSELRGGDQAPNVQYIQPPQQPAPPQAFGQHISLGQQVMELITVGEQLRRAFTPQKEDKPKEEKKEEKKKWTNFTRSDMICVSTLLMITSPWTGLWVTEKFIDAMHSWGALLVNMPK